MNHDIVSDETTFSTIFPLPYRVLALAGLGVLAWATNLHGIEVLGIDAANALDLDPSRSRATYSSLRSASPLPTVSHRGWKHASHSDPQHTSVYKLFLQYSVIVLVSWILYRSTTRGDLVLVDVFKYIPAVTVLVVLILLICPFNIFQKHERDRFFAAIHRCLFSSKKQRIYFSDVVFADIFTSFAKVFGDVWLSLYMLLPGGSLLSQPSQDGWARWILPTLMSLPYAVRFRQCIIEYVSSTDESRRPLYNALKYASSFPVIFLSAAQRTVVTDVLKGHMAEHGVRYGDYQLYRWWLFAAAVNSAYSFWWDVSHDWGLGLLRPGVVPARPRYGSRSPPKQLVLPRLHSRLESLPSRPVSADGLHGDEALDEDSVIVATKYESTLYPWGLRPTLLFPLAIYPFAVLADLVLRLTWSVKLSSHLHSYSEGDLIIFWIELAEILRRWIWVFLRVEWEVIKESHSGSRIHGGPDSHLTHRRRSLSSHTPNDSYELLPSERSENVLETGQG